eukprot:3951142-Amphidinium_carterae.1
MEQSKMTTSRVILLAHLDASPIDPFIGLSRAKKYINFTCTEPSQYGTSLPSPTVTYLIPPSPNKQWGLFTPTSFGR